MGVFIWKAEVFTFTGHYLSNTKKSQDFENMVSKYI